MPGDSVGVSLKSTTTPFEDCNRWQNAQRAGFSSHCVMRDSQLHGCRQNCQALSVVPRLRGLEKFQAMSAVSKKAKPGYGMVSQLGPPTPGTTWHEPLRRCDSTELQLLVASLDLRPRSCAQAGDRIWPRGRGARLRAAHVSRQRRVRIAGFLTSDPPCQSRFSVLEARKCTNDAWANQPQRWH